MKLDELRSVLFIQRMREGGLGTFTQVIKVGIDWPLDESATREISDKQNTPKECDDIGRWLEQHGYVQRGCFVGDDRSWATAWLKPGDEPEYLSDAIGQLVVPATLMWHFTTGNVASHIYSSLGAGNIRRSRARNSCATDDLGVREFPTLNRRMMAGGLR